MIKQVHNKQQTAVAFDIIRRSNKDIVISIKRFAQISGTCGASGAYNGFILDFYRTL